MLMERNEIPSHFEMHIFILISLHSRSRSLRERTGVDQRLERLPSGPTIIQKFTPHTVIPGSDTEKR